MQKIIIECSRFAVVPLTGGRVQLEIDEPKMSEPLAGTTYDRTGAAERLTKLLGRPVTPRTVSGWMRRAKNPLPFRKPPGTRPIFDEEALAAWAKAETPRVSLISGY